MYWNKQELLVDIYSINNMSIPRQNLRPVTIIISVARGTASVLQFTHCEKDKWIFW
jgi:hypothetical protein